METIAVVPARSTLRGWAPKGFQSTEQEAKTRLPAWLLWTHHPKTGCSHPKPKCPCSRPLRFLNSPTAARSRSTGSARNLQNQGREEGKLGWKSWTANPRRNPPKPMCNKEEKYQTFGTTLPTISTWQGTLNFSLIGKRREKSLCLSGNGCAVGEKDPQQETRCWQPGFNTAPSPPAPQLPVAEVMPLSFGWCPYSPYPKNAWGLCSKATQMQHNWRCYSVPLEAKGKGKNIKEKGKKISPLLNTWNVAMTQWQVPPQTQPRQRKLMLSSYLWEFSHKSNSCEKPFLIVFLVNIFHIGSLHWMGTAQHPLFQAAQTHSFPWHSLTCQAHLR